MFLCAVFKSRYHRGLDRLSLYVGNEMLEQVDKYKYLGIFLDNNLSFVDHIDYVVNKSRHMVYAGTCKEVHGQKNNSDAL